MIDFSQFRHIAIPEGEVAKIEAGGVTIWQRKYVNQVPTSVDTDGNVYNGTGYKDGYRVRSGGEEAESSSASCTGYIPVSGDDVVRVSGWTFTGSSSGNSINVYDEDFECLGQMAMNSDYGYGIIAGGYSDYGKASVVEESTGVWKWVVPPAASGVKYIRVSGYDGTTGAPSSAMIVTVNEEITD